MPGQVAALFVRADSIYKTLPDVDAWDAARDARAWPGGAPVVLHPPCGQWGRLRTFARTDDAEKSLGPLAVRLVREWGGVLEHPAASSLWTHCNLPQPGAAADEFGGWTLPVPQYWFGHRADKNTWLYIVGVSPAQLPALPLVLGNAPCQIARPGKRKDGTRKAGRPEITKAEREHTPPAFAQWLVEVARQCEARQ